ncbi:SAF domain-containing protein [Cellulomonas sp. Marseille-Q8402]
MPPDLVPDARRRLRVLAWRARRPLAALCAGLAALVAVDLARPADAPTAQVLVAARDLDVGARLTEDDLTLDAVPVALLPPGLGADEDLTGRRLAVAVPAGLPLVPELLVDDATTGPPGTVVVPVRFADTGVAAVLRPGMRVDVVAAPLLDGGEPVRLASGAVVLAQSGAAEAPDDGSDTGGGSLLGGGSAGASESAPVLLAVTPEESVELGGATGSRVLGAVIVG